MLARGRGWGGRWDRTDEGTQRYRLPARKLTSHGGVVHSLGSTVRNAAVTPCGDRWFLDFLCGSVHNIYKRRVTVLRA